MSHPARLAARVLGVLVLLVLLALAVQAVRASLALRDLRTQSASMQRQLVAGDFVGARRTLKDIADSAATAHDATDGFLWGWATHLPLVGDDMAAVRSVSSVSDSVATSALPTAVRLSQEIQQGTFRPTRGQYDLDAIEDLGPLMRKADRAIGDQDLQLQAVSTEGLLPFLAGPVRDLQQRVRSVASAADISARAVDLLPTMLGRDGPRTYLLVVQNNAEVRATGGLPGSFSVLHARDGKVTMGKQADTGEVGVSDDSVLPLTSDELAVYGDTLGLDIRDTNLSPDFPRVAQLMKAMWEKNIGGSIDGVVAVDPSALAAVLRGTGPVNMGPRDKLTAVNAVDKLLNGIYERFDDQERQNDYFALAARRTFDALMTGRGDQQTILRGLTTAGREHRLLLWSDESQEQDQIATTSIAGALPAKEGANPHVGMYLDDATGAKMQYYLRYATTLSSTQCGDGKRQSLSASMLLESRAPAHYQGLSPWILGRGGLAPEGSMRVNLRIYAPRGARITQVTVNSDSVAVTADQHKGRQVATVPILLRPGQKLLVAASIRTASGQDGAPVLDFTPGMVSAPNGVQVASACG